MTVSMLLHSASAALLDTDGADLRDHRLTVSHMVMIAGPSCSECNALRSHLESMQAKLSADGAAIMIAALNAQQYPRIADDLNVKIYPTFAFFPAFAATPPTVFEGTNMRSLVAWLLEQLAANGGFRPPQKVPDGGFSRIGRGMMHPAAVDLTGGRGGVGGAGGAGGAGARGAEFGGDEHMRADPPQALPAAAPVHCEASNGEPPLGLVVGGDFGVTGFAHERFSIATWQPLTSGGAWQPLGASRSRRPSNAQASGTASRPASAPGTAAEAMTLRRGALAGVARILLRNQSACLYAAGSLRGASVRPGGWEGDEEPVLRWSAAAGGWAALHGPLVRAAAAASGQGEGGAGAAGAALLYAVRDGPVTALALGGDVGGGSRTSSGGGGGGRLLYVGGGFTLRKLGGGDEAAYDTSSGSEAAGVEPPRFIAAWDASRSAWRALGAGLDAAVSAMAYDEKRGWLYVCGAFARAGPGAAHAGMAVWDAARHVWRVPPPLARLPTSGASLVQLVLGDGVLYARSSAGRIHALRGDGAWHTLPALPTQLRIASSLAWLPARQQLHRDHARRAEGEDTSDPGASRGTGAGVGGRLVAAGDFVQYHREGGEGGEGGAGGAGGEGGGTDGQLHGVATWDGGAWRMGVGLRSHAHSPSETPISHAAASGVRWGTLGALAAGEVTWRLRPQPPAAPVAPPPADHPVSLLAVGRLNGGVGLVEWRAGPAADSDSDSDSDADADADGGASGGGADGGEAGGVWSSSGRWEPVGRGGTVNAVSLLEVEGGTADSGPQLQWPEASPPRPMSDMRLREAPRRPLSWESTDDESDLEGEGEVGGGTAEGGGPSSGSSADRGASGAFAGSTTQRAAGGLSSSPWLTRLRRWWSGPRPGMPPPGRRPRASPEDQAVLLWMLILLPTVFFAYHAIISQVNANQALLASNQALASPPKRKPRFPWLAQAIAKAANALHQMMSPG